MPLPAWAIVRAAATLLWIVYALVVAGPVAASRSVKEYSSPLVANVTVPTGDVAANEKQSHNSATDNLHTSSY